MYPAEASGCLVMSKIGSRTMMFKGVKCFVPWLFIWGKEKASASWDHMKTQRPS